MRQNGAVGHRIKNAVASSRQEFPGAPVRLTRESDIHVLFMDQTPCFYTPYVRGIRAVLYHGQEGLYWHDEQGCVRPLRLDGLPTPKTVDDRTVVDAIWVPEKRTFCIYDAILVRGQEVDNLDVQERMGHLKVSWVEKIRKTITDQFSLVIQEYNVCTKDVIESATNTHAIIFSSCAMGFRKLIWFRDTSLASVYLKLEYCKDMSGTYYFSLWATSYGGIETLFCQLPWLSTRSIPHFPSGQIAECTYDTSETRWRVKKITNTKRAPDTVKYALEIETALVGQSHLVDAIGNACDVREEDPTLHGMDEDPALHGVDEWETDQLNQQTFTDDQGIEWEEG